MNSSREYKVNINGIDVDASYKESAVEGELKPLLRRLSEMHDQKKNRILVMLAAPPGAGKSTLISFLEVLAKEVIPDKKVQAIGMDGFHKRQDYLLSHTTTVDGKEIPMVEIKGAPITFDLDGLKAKIRELASGRNTKWPIYDRLLHNPVEDAVFADGDIILLEGNYLLLDLDGWKDLSDFADYTIFLSADPKLLRERLIARKRATGTDSEKAEKFVDFSDMANVKTCLEHSKKPDLTLFVKDF